MTDSQIKYQSFVENQRHNYEMERIGAQDARTNRLQAEVAQQNADTNVRKQDLAEKNARVERMEKRTQSWYNIMRTVVAPFDAGSNIMKGAGSLLKGAGSIASLFA